MAEPELRDLRLQVANALVIAAELLELEMRHKASDAPGRADGLLLMRELDLVLQHARQFAGLNPDGTFDKVPPAKKGGGR